MSLTCGLSKTTPRPDILANCIITIGVRQAQSVGEEDVLDIRGQNLLSVKFYDTENKLTIRSWSSMTRVVIVCRQPYQQIVEHLVHVRRQIRISLLVSSP
jgi:hypothetical protein